MVHVSPLKHIKNKYMFGSYISEKHSISVAYRDFFQSPHYFYEDHQKGKTTDFLSHLLDYCHWLRKFLTRKNNVCNPGQAIPFFPFALNFDHLHSNHKISRFSYLNLIL